MLPRCTDVCQCCVAVYIMGWGEGGMLTFLVLLPLHLATLHRCLLWKERKKKPVNMPQWNESKTHTKCDFCQIRENLAQFGLQKCLFLCGENVFFWKTVVFTSPVSGPPGCLWHCVFRIRELFEHVLVQRSCQFLEGVCVYSLWRPHRIPCVETIGKI